MSRRAVAVSPHLDDAVFSAGATLARLHTEGWDVSVVTVFTASVPDPAGFALACQTDKGLAPDVDYMALRRAEDFEALRRLRLGEPVHLDLPEAPHRGYGSAAELFAGARPDDDVAPAITKALAPHLDGADVVLTCQGVGGHVDHLKVLEALGGRATRRWRDLPYGLRAPDAADFAGPPPPLPFAAVKAEACCAYTTQLDFQFGGEDACRRTMAAAPEHVAP